jgi:hypothetical protein
MNEGSGPRASPSEEVRIHGPFIAVRPEVHADARDWLEAADAQHLPSRRSMEAL